MSLSKIKSDSPCVSLVQIFYTNNLQYRTIPDIQSRRSFVDHNLMKTDIVGKGDYIESLKLKSTLVP